MIFILEDDEDRLKRFHAVAPAVAPNVQIRSWRSAHRMIADLIGSLQHASIISLDHDLHPMPDDAGDPGTGYDVVKVLENLIPCCPVIIHTSNGDRGTWMEGGLTRAGWNYKRVHPFGENWIETDWARTLRRLLSPS